MDELYEYQPETYEELSFDLFRAVEVIKYLYSLKPKAEDYKLLTPALEAEFHYLRDNCEEFMKAFDYYSKK